jgi:dihydroflavonol-4-reductase
VLLIGDDARLAEAREERGEPREGAVRSAAMATSDESWAEPLRGARVLITGATGFLGSAMAEQLCDRGAVVRALVRGDELAPNLRGRDVQAVKGSLLDAATLDRALDGVTYVFHVAADVRMYRAAWDEAFRSNVTATKLLAERSAAAKVRRLVYTSSGSTLGKPHDAFDGPPRPVDERSEYNFDGLGWVYPPTKFQGERAVLEACASGLDAVITHPTAIFGPGDWKQNLLPLYRAPKQLLGRFATNGTRSVCDVRDVAEGHLRAAVLGVAGERYALAGEVLSVRELMGEIAAAVGGRGPRWVLPAPAVLGLARVIEAVAVLRGRPPLLSREMAMQSCFRVAISSAKAERALGYRSRPARESIADGAAFYRAQGWLA